MDRDTIRAAQRLRDGITDRPAIEPSVIDEFGNPVRLSPGRERHPQMRQQGARRLEPWRDEEEDYYHQQDQRGLRRQDQRGDVNVSVSNDGRYYRTVREELQVKGGSMLMDLVAWPFRLVKGFVETIVNGLAGLFGFVIKMLILPAVLLMGYGIYESSRDRPASETAKVVGKESVGIIGGLFKGIWNGIVGDDEPAAKNTDDKAKSGKDGAEGGKDSSAK